ncbi:hypothetical protein Tco_0655528 [Tanacetum coccineum]|uniref:Retrovirus-related Pol polyprotein from transposon TNT 1-94 n=1 Tax=Tanacetum coccineum TaxID=301880 RepID=A0ABQ4X6B9_9ASTR
MFGTVPPIPPPLGTNTCNTGSPNHRGSSHVTSVPGFDKHDFTSWKVRFMIFLDGLEPYLLKTLEEGPFVLMSSIIIISCLPNDVMKSVIKCKTAKEIWNDLILAHEGPSDTRDTKIAALRLKFNAFKSLEGEKVNGTFTRLKCLLNDLENNGVVIPQAEVNATFDSDSDVEEDNRSSNEFLADLNVEFHERALLANKKRYYKRSGRVGSARNPMDKSKETCFACGKINALSKGKAEKGKCEKGLIAESFDWDEESVSSDDEGTTKIKAFMAITEDEPSVRKADARSGQWVEITIKKTCSKVTLDQLISEQVPGNIVQALGGKGRRKERTPCQDVSLKILSRT